MHNQTPENLWRCRDFWVDLARPRVMGILNVTPDSFSDGGQYADPAAAAEHALEIVAQGADLVDIGGESTRPGSDPVDAAEQLRRVLPVLERLAGRDLLISVDTSSAEVARATLDTGASIVNDITALRGDPAMAGLVAETGAGVVLMHMQGTPKTMQTDPRYTDVVVDIAEFLARRIDAATRAGIAPEQIVLDPGIGFGKTLDHNLEILRRLNEFKRIGWPLLVGPSRKGFIGKILGTDVQDRLEGTAAAVTAAVLAGVSVIRVHDVAVMVRVIRVADAIRRGAAAVESGNETMRTGR